MTIPAQVPVHVSTKSPNPLSPESVSGARQRHMRGGHPARPRVINAASVVSQTEAFHDAGGNDDVLQGRADFHADHVIAGIT
jgi:hypothetical protein